jgi:hypothetical protein
LLVPSGDGRHAPPVVLYREPGLGRIAEVDAVRFPRIFPEFTSPEGCLAIVVTAKMLDWYRVVYDDGEREGWIEGRLSYRYQRWGDVLQGRRIVLPDGMKSDHYLLRTVPDPAYEAHGKIVKGSGVTVISSDGDWVQVRSDSDVIGWLRWRDDNGRLLISVNR